MLNSELADPYLTPKTLPARRPLTYLALGLIVGVVLLSVAAGSLMVYWAISPSRLNMERRPAIDNRDPIIFQNRGPVKSSPQEQPTNVSRAAIP